MSELQPVRYRRNWKGIIADYDAVILHPESTEECLYCLTEPQAQLLMMYADTLRWRTRWINWDGDSETIEDFANDLIERLIMPCCPEQNQEILTRLSSDGTYTLEISYDGGETWQTDNSDPRLTTVALPPLPEETTNLKCQAAWNMRKGIEDAVQAIAGVLDVTLTLFAISAAIAGILAVILFDPTEAYRLIPIVISLATQIAALSDTDFLAAFGTSDYDDLQCAIYCNLNDAGQLTDIAPMLAQLFETVPETGIPGNAFKLIAYGIGLIGLNAMGSTDRGTIGYDCSACGCGSCTETWDTGYSLGTIIERGTDGGGDYIKIESVFDGTEFGGYGWVLLSPDVNDCCTYLSVETVSGAAPSIIKLNQCSVAVPSYGAAWPGYAGTDINGVLLAAGSVGVYKLYLGA